MLRVQPDLQTFVAGANSRLCRI